MQQTEITRRTNKRVMIASFMLILLAILGYVMELVRGTRDLSYVLLMSLSLLAPIGFSYIFYRHPKFIEAFKGIALYSFIVSWMIMLSFSPKVIQYVLIFPLLVIYVLYYDYKLIRNASILVFVYGIVKVVLNIRLYGMTDSFMMTEYTVFMLSLIAFGLVAVNTISFSIKIRNQQMESIIAEKEKNAQLLDEMKSVMDVIQKTTKAVHHITNDLMTTSDLASIPSSNCPMASRRSLTASPRSATVQTTCKASSSIPPTCQIASWKRRTSRQVRFTKERTRLWSWTAMQTLLRRITRRYLIRWWRWRRVLKRLRVSWM